MGFGKGVIEILRKEKMKVVCSITGYFVCIGRFSFRILVL